VPEAVDLPDCYHRGYEYLDAAGPDGDDAEDKNPINKLISVDPFDEERTPVNVLREIMMAEFTDREKEIYRLVYIEGLAKGEAALLMGIKPWWASQLIKSIKKKISESEELKKFFYEPQK
jgi:DNA-directed RNA polymerase specialized sigma subunit